MKIQNYLFFLLAIISFSSFAVCFQSLPQNKAQFCVRFEMGDKFCEDKYGTDSKSYLSTTNCSYPSYSISISHRLLKNIKSKFESLHNDESYSLKLLEIKNDIEKLSHNLDINKLQNETAQFMKYINQYRDEYNQNIAKIPNSLNYDLKLNKKMALEYAVIYSSQPRHLNAQTILIPVLSVPSHSREQNKKFELYNTFIEDLENFHFPTIIETKFISEKSLYTLLDKVIIYDETKEYLELNYSQFINDLVQEIQNKIRVSLTDNIVTTFYGSVLPEDLDNRFERITEDAILLQTKILKSVIEQEIKDWDVNYQLKIYKNLNNELIQYVEDYKKRLNKKFQ